MTVNILSAVTAAGQLFGGFSTLTLGPVQFSGLELPSHMPIGGKQAVVVHDMPGGARQVDVMGPREGIIRWHGILYGQAQSTRARQLDRLRQSGQVVRLAWGEYAYDVIVVDFGCGTKIVGPMPYRIACLVVRNSTNPQGTSLLRMAAQVTADIQSGQPLAVLGALSAGVAVPAGTPLPAAVQANAAAASASLATVAPSVAASLTGATDAVNSAASAVSASGAMTAGTSLFATATKEVNAAAGAIRSARQQADTFLEQAAGPLAQAVGVSPTDFSVSHLTQAVSDAASASGIAASMASSHGYMARVLANLLGASA